MHLCKHCFPLFQLQINFYTSTTIMDHKHSTVKIIISFATREKSTHNYTRNGKIIKFARGTVFVWLLLLVSIFCSLCRRLLEEQCSVFIRVRLLLKIYHPGTGWRWKHKEEIDERKKFMESWRRRGDNIWRREDGLVKSSNTMQIQRKNAKKC